MLGRGYQGGQQPGNAANQGRTTNNALGSTATSGGSHGGFGGVGTGTPNPLYGSVVTPLDLGSGGSSRGDNFFPGGDGGGRIFINALNVAADGEINANGLSGSGFNSGSGSGGSIYMIVRSLSGNGIVAADGGQGEVGGGGGRVAVHYIDLYTKDTGLIQAIGGDATTADGGNGTVFLLGFGESNGTLIVDGQGVSSPFSGLPIPVGLTFDNIILRNNARVVVDDVISVNGSLQVLSGSILTHSVTQTNGIRINAGSVFVDSTASINASAKGYRGGFRDGNAQSPGETLNGQVGAQAKAGGSYGGLGAVNSGPGSNLGYGTPYAPIYLGAGGSSRGDNFFSGGNGGGRITIVATNRVTVHGAITADGQDGTGFQSGSGAGGSIWIQTALFEGSGSVRANGGAFEVGGGGGRIRVDYNFIGSGTNDFNGLRNVTAAGGKSTSQAGSAGSVLMKSSSQGIGDLYIDATYTNATAPLWSSTLTPVGLGRSVALTTNELTVDGEVALLPGGLVGATLVPNENNGASFTIVANTATTITVSVTASSNLLTVASTGDVYAAKYVFDNVILRRGAWLATSDKLSVNGTLTVSETSVITHFDSNVGYEPGLDITADTITVESNSAINVDSRGYLGGWQGDNAGNNQGRTLTNGLGSTARSAGSHGGVGGRTDGTPNATYGDVKNPVALGSGGSSRGDNFAPGGDGGGRILITASTLTVNGVLTANGTNGTGFNSGSGSGGSILLDVGTLQGTGIVRANGAAFEVGGGGGRVAVLYSTLGMGLSQIQALGGDASAADGGHGTVFLKTPSQVDGTLIIDGGNQSSPDDSVILPAGVTFDNITIRNQAKVLADAPIVVSGTLRVENSSKISHTRGLASGLVITAAVVEVDSTSRLDVSAKGYRGGFRDGNAQNPGETLNSQVGAQAKAGGSYGGLGAVNSGPGSNLVYGTPYAPVYLGAGGSSRGDNFSAGGNGGGRITIVATNRVTVHGAIAADGQEATSGFNAGSGAGGSIWIQTALFEGSGSVRANGGAFEVGGGGGRIRVDYNFIGSGTNDFNGLRNVTAAGGKSTSQAGSAGSVLMKSSSQGIGDLYIDATYTNATAPLWSSTLTPVGLGRSVALTTNELTVDGEVALLPGGLVGATLVPNENNGASFTIVANTATTITVSVTASSNLLTVASTGDVYAAKYVFDNVILRRGAWLATSDKLSVNGTLTVSETSVITHFDSNVGYEPGLDITADTITVESNSAINVDSRGYLGGWQGDNAGNNQGRTLTNGLGSTARSAGSHGGVGGRTDGTPNATYGDVKNPVALGSGGSSRGDNFAPGGDGGGRILITASTLTVNGVLTANGTNGTGFNSGSGSGGSILLDVGTLQGTGIVRANGAAFEVGGGGGRVAVLYSTLGMSESLLRATGGDGGVADGGHGTVYLKSSSQTNGNLIVDGYGFATASDSTQVPTNEVFDQVVFRNGARIQLRAPLVVLGGVQILSNSVVTHALSLEEGLTIQAQSMLIDTNSSIDVSSRGYRGGQRDGNGLNEGLTTNNTVGSGVRSGGSYGGLGGVNGGTPNPLYGTATNPVYLGSGGSSRSDNFSSGGNGGGRITLQISGALTLNGNILANGGPGGGFNAGGGSGGSVLIQAGNLSGSGLVRANGGGTEVGGGGGRVAIYHNVLSLPTNNVTASGGSGTSPGAVGTVYFGPLLPPPAPAPALENLEIEGIGIDANGCPWIVWSGASTSVVLEASSGLLDAHDWSNLCSPTMANGWTGTPAGLPDVRIFRVRKP